MRGWSDNTRGALLMMAAMGFFTVNDSFLKGIGTTVNVWQILFLRGIGISLVLLVIMRLRGVRFSALSGRDWLLSIARSLAEAGAALLFVSALQRMPFANATAILQALPLTVTLVGFLFLHEPVGWRRGMAIGIGLAGMILIVRPGAEGFNAWSLLAIGAVACVTARDIFARMLSPAAPSLAVAAVSALGVTAVAVAGLPFVGFDPVTMTQGGLLLGAIIAVTIGYITSVSAMRVGEIGFVAPFRYFSLLIAIILGMVFFDEVPDSLTLLGAGIIVGSGLYTLWRERRLAL